MTGQLQDLQKQLEGKQKQLQEKKEENTLLKQQVEQDYPEKSKTLERFPLQIDQVRTIVMRMVYSHKQAQLENHVEAIQEISLQNTFQHEGLSFCTQGIKQENILVQTVHVKKGFHLQKQKVIYQDGAEIQLLEPKKSPWNLCLKMGYLVS